MGSLKAKISSSNGAHMGCTDLVSQYAAELVGAQVDVIATGGEEAIRAAQQATKTIPIVACLLRRYQGIISRGCAKNGASDPNVDIMSQWSLV